MQLIKVNDGSYERYEKLLLKRDQLEKDAAQILIEYTREFGDLLTEGFEAKIACIRLKKEIAWCQAQLNRGTVIDADAMKQEIDRVMAAFYRELKDMYAETKAAKDSERISAVTVVAVKRIYRKLAKQLHPDINPMTAREPKLSELWNRISIAYNANDLEELRELEVLAAAAGDRLILQRENNKFDEHAILILNEKGKKMGYVPEKDNLVFSRLMDAGKLLTAKIKSITQIGTFTQIQIQIYLVDF